jgi:hypothetical protein
MPPFYSNDKEVVLKRLYITVKGFFNNSDKPKDLEGIASLLCFGLY